jgi:hypothetical protein
MLGRVEVRPMSDEPRTDTPPPPQTAEDPTPEPSSGMGILPLIALASLVLSVVALVVLRSTDAEPEAPAPASQERAEEVATPVRLSLFVEREGRAEPLPPGTDIAVGDRVLFELSSEGPTSARLWIEEGGVTIKDLGNVETDSSPVMVGGEGGLLAWGFGAARTVTVRASAADRGCPATSCASQVVVAR